MPAKKSGCLRNFLAVAFTTVVTPVLASVIAQDVKDWQDGLSAVLEGKTTVRTDWSRPVVEEPARPTHGAFPAPYGTAVAEQSAPNPAQPSAERKPGQWHWAAGAWGQ